MDNHYAGLGRGLDSLIPKKRNGAVDLGIREQILGPQERLYSIDPLMIDVNPHQPRKSFDHGSLEELVNSIKEYGILQPLIAGKKGKRYELISGERRLRAAKILELDTVPVIVRDASEQEKLALALIENVQRKDLNPIERAWGYARLIEEFSLTQEQAAKKVGQSRASLTNTLRMLKLPDEIQKSLIDNSLTEGHAKVLLGVQDQQEQKKLFLKMLKEQLSVRAAEHYVRIARPSKRKTPAHNPELEELKERLQRALGTKVDVVKRGKQGVIHIYFYSDGELKEILGRIGS